MGTNYYWHEETKPACAHCGKSAEEEVLHIGKSSAGWCFSLHVTDEIKSLDDWKAKFAGPGKIINEYDEPLTVAQMLEIITERSWPTSSGWTAYEYSQNFAEPGPNNLARHRIGDYCVGHGEGTWDLMPGCFS